jgi:Lrp/AsnC family transcriptional regulator for asnA, asnC and gidA
MSIDETDRKLLKILNWNARLSYREIARQVNLSTGTVISRMDKLKKNGTINGFYTRLDAKKLGYTLTAVIEVIATKGMFLEAAEKISSFPNVLGVYAVSGEIDAIVVAKFKDSDDLNEFLKKLNKDPEVIRTNTRIVLRAMKEDPRIIV